MDSGSDESQVAPKLEGFLNNNIPPPDSLLPTVKGRLETSKSELSQIRGEMDALESRLAAFRQRFQAAQQSISNYETILSPIRRIPADVLREIFFHCLPTHRNSLLLPSEAPILPSHICSTWRSVVLSTPCLWTRLHISLPGTMPTPPNESRDELSFGSIDTNSIVVRCPTIMQRRSEAVKEWLGRSARCPLSLSIMYPGFPSGVLEGVIDRTAEMVFDVIVPSYERWKDVELTLPLDLYKNFEAKIVSRNLTMLTSIRLSLDTRTHETIWNGAAAPAIALLSAPNIQDVSLSLIGIQPFGFAYLDSHSKMAPIWGQLSRLFLHTVIPDKDLHRFLRACPRLVECGLWVYEGFAEPGVPTLSVPDNEDVVHTSGMVYLPYLQTFKITDSGSPALMQQVFVSFCAPELKRIDYWGTRHEAYVVRPSDLSSPLLALLEGAQSIHTLSLNPQCMRREDIVSYLGIPSKLRHLIIGARPQTYEPEGPTFYRWSPPLYNELLFPIHEIVVKEDAPFDGRDHIPLPFLESFEAYEPCDIPDVALQKFICSRVGLAAERRGISSLKKVKIAFERPMQEDISEEVKRCARQSGLEVELDLTYTPKYSNTKHPLSVEFGLTEKSRRTWSYTNVES